MFRPPSSSSSSSAQPPGAGPPPSAPPAASAPHAGGNNVFARERALAGAAAAGYNPATAAANAAAAAAAYDPTAAAAAAAAAFAAADPNLLAGLMAANANPTAAAAAAAAAFSPFNMAAAAAMLAATAGGPRTPNLGLLAAAGLLPPAGVMGLDAAAMQAFTDMHQAPLPPQPPPPPPAQPQPPSQPPTTHAHHHDLAADLDAFARGGAGGDPVVDYAAMPEIGTAPTYSLPAMDAATAAALRTPPTAAAAAAAARAASRRASGAQPPPSFQDFTVPATATDPMALAASSSSLGNTGYSPYGTSGYDANGALISPTDPFMAVAPPPPPPPPPPPASAYPMRPTPSPGLSAPPPPRAPLCPRTSVPGLYSSTGFDMIGVLSKVASRPNPQVSIGPVDMSCSFVVSDARKPDMPIVYVSDTFERLTGYSAGECVGKNCRFLQSPDGLVNEGSHRRYTDNASVYSMKQSIMSQRECQYTLINYRKGGEPFINLITIIPIAWGSDDDTDIAYFVGFQVDLVEQPNAIMNRMKDGTYVVNYQIADAPVAVPRVLRPPQEALPTVPAALAYARPSQQHQQLPHQPHPMLTHPTTASLVLSANTTPLAAGGNDMDVDLAPLEDAPPPGPGESVPPRPARLVVPDPRAGWRVGGGITSTATSTTTTPATPAPTPGVNSGGSGGSGVGHAPGHFAMDVTDLVGVRHAGEAADLFYRALVDQVDFVHVLSLKGVFLYVSRDCQRVLEYDETELIGKPLSQFCHPGDLVSVMRELKDSSTGLSAVHIVYRIRRKRSGYMWMEVAGRCTQGEKSKGKKFVVLTGREKPVVRVHRADIARVGGIRDASPDTTSGPVTVAGTPLAATSAAAAAARLVVGDPMAPLPTHGGADLWAKLALEGLFLHVSAEAPGLLGFTPAELVGKSLLDLVHIDDLPALRRALALVRAAHVVALPHRIKNKKGEYLSVTSALIPGNSARPGGVRFALHRCSAATGDDAMPVIPGAPPLIPMGGNGWGIRAAPALAVVEDADDLFDVLSPVRCTSWQYELHQLRLQNRRLRAELDEVDTATRSKKRQNTGNGTGGVFGSSSGGSRGGG
ncbi:blue light receptor [Allomyces arbusculus]|nr:blue light receptor [Allomyces arbusculus]